LCPRPGPAPRRILFSFFPAADGAPDEQRDRAGRPLEGSEIFDPALGAFVYDDGTDPAPEAAQVTYVSPAGGATGVLPAARVALRFRRRPLHRFSER
jgi:hypothetical protein